MISAHRPLAGPSTAGAAPRAAHPADPATSQPGPTEGSGPRPLPARTGADGSAEAFVPITASKAAALYWLGRYTERVFTTLRSFFPYYDDVLDHDPERFRPFAQALGLDLDGTDFGEMVSEFLYSEDEPSSVCSSMRQAFDAAVLLRPELGTETLAHIEMASTLMHRLKDSSERLIGQRNVADHILTFWGALEDSDALLTVKAFVFLGKYVERIDLYARLRRPAAQLATAAARVRSYLLLLGSQPLPGLFAEGLEASRANAVAHGYPEPLLDDLGTLVEQIRGRASQVASPSSAEGSAPEGQ